MSLHTLANHLQSAGRGEDKMLVHMTPREVGGLQSLAMAHGGSLTINPHTGLPEAGFLSAILPMVASAAATAMGVPMSPMQMAAAATAIGTATSGSLGKGLQMGLGAYSGATLGASLMGPEAATGVANISPALSSAEAAARAGQVIGGGVAPSAATTAAAVPNMPVGLSSTGYTPPVTTTPMPAANPLGVQPQFNQAAMTPTPPVVASSSTPATAGAQSVESSITDRLQKMGGNIGKLFGGTDEDKKYRDEFLKENKIPLMGAGLSALMLSREEPKVPKETTNYQRINPAYYQYMQNQKMNYGPYTNFADGGLANLPVEQMSQQASVGANTNYPMANLRPYGYSTPRNVPISENVFKPADYERTDPYTGEAKFASGGLSTLHFKSGGAFVSQLKPVAQPKKATPKLQDTSKLESQVSSLDKYSGLGDAQNRINDINNQIKGLNKKSPDYKTTSAQLSKDLKAAQADLKNYNSYKSVADKLNAAKSANEAATNKANQQYEDAMSKYNEYQNALADEKKAWEEQTTRKSTGLQAIKPQTETKPAIPPKEGTYTPALVKDSKGNYVPTSELPPVTSFKKFGSMKEVAAALYNKNTKANEPEDIQKIFQDIVGRNATQKELNDLVGNNLSTLQVAQYAEKRPDFTAKTSYSDSDLAENWKYYLGKDPSAGDLAAMKRAQASGKLSTFKDLRNYITNRPQYLENINAVAQAAYTDQQKQAEKAAAEAASAAASLAPEDIQSAYKTIYNRAPTLEELKQYKGAQLTPEALSAKLKDTDEYLKTLTVGNTPATSFTPAAPATTFTPTAVTKYAPGTTLTYTPPETTAPAGITGLQAPTGRGVIDVQGAYPIPPDWYKQQIGIQNLATAAAEKAPTLQTGLQFAAPQQVFQPYAGQQSPQSLESLLAALRAQQAQGTTQMAMGGMAQGGYNLGGYSDGGRLLKGPGDGVSDSIPASIGDRQPARLADGEFVIPARIVSELGNGSTDAGARKLYAMMDRVQRARRKTIGRDAIAVKSGADKMLPV